MKRTDVERLGTMGRVDARVPTAQSRVSSGEVLWTLTRGNSTAEARRWSTASGLELELHIWTGPRIRGEEDLSWVQSSSRPWHWPRSANSKTGVGSSSLRAPPFCEGESPPSRRVFS
jgi:hypothetical protein